MIEISRSYVFDAPIERVWSGLMDITVLAACIPGCQSLEPLAEGRYALTLMVKLAAVMGSYSGTVEIVDQNPMVSYGLNVEGQGRPGFVKGSGAITLTAAGSSTELTVVGTAQAGGSIARVGQRIIRAAARFMMDRFFKRLKARIEGTSEADIDSEWDPEDLPSDES